MLIVPLFVVPLHGKHGEDQDEHAEDEALHQPNEELKAVERNWNKGDCDCCHHSERKFAAVNVAEESHGERDRLDELKKEFKDTNDETDWAALQREELSKIPAESQRSKSLVVKVEEGNECKANGDIDITCWRAEFMDASNAWNEARPVGNRYKEEAGEEERDEWLCASATDSNGEVGEAFNCKFQRVLHLSWNLLESACGNRQRDDDDGHHHPAHDD